MLQTNVTGLCGEHSQCSGHTGFAPYQGVCAFPVYTAQAPGCSIWSRPCVACGSSFGVLHRSADLVGPAFCAFPAPAAQAARSLTGALCPGAVRLIPSGGPASVSVHASRVHAPCVCSGELASSRDPPSGCQPSRISGSVWLETGSLLCCLVGGAVSGTVPLPPASGMGGGWWWNGPVCRLLALLWNCSVFLSFCQQLAVCSGSCAFLVNVFSLSCHPTV